MGERRLLLCGRVADTLPQNVVAGSLQLECDACHQMVWASPASLAVIGTDGTTRCTCCSPLGIDAVPPTRAQVAEIVGHVRRN